MVDHTESKTRLGITEVFGDKREEVLRLAAKHGASNVRVFGSVARGEARSDSDVDLLVDWDYERLSPWGSAGFEMEVEELLGRHVDVVSTDYIHPLMREQILKDAIPL
ncbi:MAG: nucleotidyltransferase family protein [Anaerolineae bacterium]|nr:nucleotidyltransferase family protein [Anaerolineae bacterium]